MKMASIDLISKKTNCTCSTLFFLISKKTNLHVQHAFCLSLPLFCTTTTLFCRTKTSNFLVTHYFYGGIVVCVYPIFCLLYSRSTFALIFYCRSFSLRWPLAYLIVSQPLWIFMFFFTRSSSFSVIHLSWGEGGGRDFRNFWVGCAAGTVDPLANTRTSSAEFCYPILG